MNTRSWAAICLLLLLLMLFPGINHGIWRPDEPRVAGICAGMAYSGDYGIPYLNGRPFLEKPPLYFMAGALSGSVFGKDKDISYRLVSLSFCILTLIIVYFMVSGREGYIYALIAAGILATSWEFFQISRWIQVDIALVFGVVLAMYAYLGLIEHYRIRDSILLGIALGVTFMVKGLVGVGIIGAAIITDIIRQKDIRLIWRIKPYIVIALMLVPIAPWIVYLFHTGGWPFVREVIVVNNIGRFTGATEALSLGHHHGIMYYLDHFPRDFLPWTFLFIPAFIRSIRGFKDDPYISWFIGPFILLCLASTKRGVYLVPLYPAAACMIASFLECGIHKKWEDVMLKITWAVAILFCIAPFIGIFIGYPTAGISLGIVSVAALIVVARQRVFKHVKGFSLVVVICIGIGCSTTIYYDYMKPRQDFLGFTKKALSAAQGSDIVILSPDEIFEGVLPMLTGKTFKEVVHPKDIKKGGLFIWAERHDAVLNALKERAGVDIILEQKIGSKQARLAYIMPDGLMHKSNIEECL
ncbi:MAG: glycosyltransferase family 39 protein [Deltaproteobacteria bacterium]|nr:glycosyltransferase family 39 protein [Deltaproteobacteria bacterium]